MAKTLQKPVDGFEGLTYTAWPHKDLKKYPITKKHIGGRVWLAGESKRSKVYLISVHMPGDPMWPRGGFTLQHRGMDYQTDHFPDEVRAFPPKKKKAKSQLARSIRSGDIPTPIIPEDNWDPEDADEREKTGDPEIFSTDMTAAGAAEFIKETPIGKLENFVTKDESRVTVTRAWEKKNQEARDKLSTDMKAVEAAKYIRDTPAKNLIGFVPEDESRKTVHKAWENKPGV